jgi:hypothetical protein
MLFDPYTYDLTTSNKPSPLDADALLAVPLDARDVLWEGLTEAVEGALDLWERLPCGHQAALPPCAVQHAGKRRFQPQALRQQTLSGWHRLAGIELRLAAEALEALVLADSTDQQERLAEQCARVGQLYSEMERRAGQWVARALLKWEVRLLRYRASPAVSTLVYD